MSDERRCRILLTRDLVTRLFRCGAAHRDLHSFPTRRSSDLAAGCTTCCRSPTPRPSWRARSCATPSRSEEHTSELQSRPHLVCRLLLEKKKETPSPRRPRTPAERPHRGHTLSSLTETRAPRA